MSATLVLTLIIKWLFVVAAWGWFGAKISRAVQRRDEFGDAFMTGAWAIMMLALFIRDYMRAL